MIGRADSEQPLGTFFLYCRTDNAIKRLGLDVSVRKKGQHSGIANLRGLNNIDFNKRYGRLFYSDLTMANLLPQEEPYSPGWREKKRDHLTSLWTFIDITNFKKGTCFTFGEFEYRFHDRHYTHIHTYTHTPQTR